MRFTRIFSSLFLMGFTVGSSSALAQPVLKTKQPIKNIRFLADDGKITYYQKRSGELQLSTNYNFATILKGNHNTQYSVDISSAKKFVLIERQMKEFNTTSLFKNNEIFITAYGKKAKVTKIGMGVSPRLHLNDSWVSFFDVETKEIILRSVVDPTKQRRVKISNQINPFFIPNVGMITPNDFIFDDINKKGHSALLMYSLIEKKFQTIYKGRFPGNSLSFCTREDKIYLGDFPHDSVHTGSLILDIPLYGNKKFQNYTVLYSSPNQDIGNIVCTPKNIYFIKTVSYNNLLNLKTTEVARLELESREVTIQSSLKYVNQIIKMGKKVLSPFRDKYYVFEGQSDLLDDSIKGKEK